MKKSSKRDNGKNREPYTAVVSYINSKIDL
jgi:hypothetical protein